MAVTTTTLTADGTAFDPEFPCSITISTPLPDHRLAETALRALEVDAELSPLVHRSFSLAPSPGASEKDEQKTVLLTHYKATTNRMLRVAVNGFMESLLLVLEVMQELDVDVLEALDVEKEKLEGGEGIEKGMVG